MFAEAETWVAIAFLILMAIFAYVGVHRTVLTALDHRRDRIKAELDEARRLKDEAAKLLADYKARHASAEREAQDIVTSAKAEAERIAAEAKTKMEDFVARRTKTAEGKIALAEAQAIADVRAAAANAAVTGKLGSALVRVLPETSAQASSYMRVVTPDGKTGFVSVDSVAPIGGDELCYVKDGGAWKITGYIGGGNGQ